MQIQVITSPLSLTALEECRAKHRHSKDEVFPLARDCVVTLLALDHAKALGVGDSLREPLPQLLLAAVVAEEESVETGVGCW